MKQNRAPAGARLEKRIELSGKNAKLHIVLIALLLVIAAAAFVAGLSALLNTVPGWTEVECASTQRNCSGDFVLNYDFSDMGASATAANKALTNLYSQAAEDAYRIFSPNEAADDNVYHLNAHINEPVAVSGVLYDALALVERYGNRAVYLAPVYAEYDRVFYSESEDEAAWNDPGQNEQLMPYITQAAAFANDPQMIRVELLGENRVQLTVAEEYLTFARENSIETFLDFGWMKNAFIADYIAGLLAESGYTRGYLASYDGFTRNLDSRGISYSYNLFDRLDSTIYLPAIMDYNTPLSIVYLRNYPMSQQDRWSYYAFTGGRIATIFIDPADGVSKSATDNIVSYSETASCAQILMELMPVFVADEFSADTVNALRQEGIYSIWFEDTRLLYNGEAPRLQDVPEGVGYTAEPVS